MKWIAFHFSQTVNSAAIDWFLEYIGERDVLSSDAPAQPPHNRWILVLDDQARKGENRGDPVNETTGVVAT